MQSKPENVDQQVADRAKYLLQSTKYSEPWWHGVGNNTIAGEKAAKTSSAEYLNVTVTSGATQSQANGIRCPFCKVNVLQLLLIYYICL